MADPISSLRTNRGEPTLFDKLSTAGQISQEDQYAANPENQFSKGLRTGAAGLTAGSFASEALRKEVAGDATFTDPRDRALQTVRDTRMYAPRVSSLRDVNSIGDAGDFAAGAIGQGVMSMAPTIAAAALTRGRGLAGKATAFGGAMVPAYEMERGEAALNQYQDPEQMKASAQERDLAATAKGGINAALESIVPAGLGGSILRKPAGSFLGHVGRDVLTEGATEGAQQVVGFGAQKYIDPTKELDPWDVADAVAAGALTGGAMSGATRGPAHAAQAILDKAPKPQMPEIKNPFQRGDEAGGVVDLPEDPSGGGSGPADTMLDKVAGLGAAVQDRFGDDIAAAGGKAKDIVSDTLDRMTEAVDTSANPGEFLNKVFGSNIDEEAAADLSGQPNPTLKGATFEETEANIARDDEQRVARAARYADELLNDPATPAEIKQRVADMGGDYANPDNQSFVARTLVAQRGGEKIAKAVQDLVDLGKSAFAKGSGAAGEGLSAAKKAVGDAATAAQDRIVKKNLQSASPAEQAAFGKVVFDGLTDEAKANPLVRAQLAQVTNAVMAFAAKTGDITSKDLPTLTKMANAMSLFKDPDAMAAQLVEYGAIPRDADSFLGRIKRIQNAQQDLKQPNSFLVSSLTPETREQLTAPMLKRVAQLVDEFSLRDAAGEGDRIVEGLAQAFGSKENAQAVLDYYAQQNKANVRFDPNEQVRDAAGEIDSEELSSWEGSINERDAGKAAFRFKDAKSMRPFFKGSKDIDAARRDGTLGDEGTQAPYGYDQYVAETGRDGEAEVNRLLGDIDDRITEHEKRKGEDRSAMINALKGEKSMVQDAYMRGGAQGALAMYEVLRTEAKDQNDLVATDEDLAKYASKKGASRVTFKRTDGTKLMLSAESMWKTFGDKTKGDTSGGKEGDTARARRLFKEAVASVLAREDIASLETNLSGLKIDDKGTEAEPKIDPVLREKIAHDLNKASGSLSEIKVGLQRMFKEYSAALSKGNLGKQAVYTFEDQLRTRVGQAANAVEAATTAPQRAVMRERHLLYERALERVLEMKQNYLDDGVGGNNNTDDLDPPIFSRLRKEMDTSKGERRVEEDTGAPVGTGSAPFMKPAAQKDLPEPKAKPAAKNPAASSRETAKKVDDSQALSPDAFTALHDVVVKENYDRLDTPVKVLKFAAMAAKAREQLKKIPELERTDVQDDLRFKLNDMFKQDGAAAFDWESLWDGLDPTDAQKAQLEDLIRPKAEPGTALRGERVRKHSFVGAAADPEGAARADKALNDRVDPATVWKEQGWFRGPDGQLRKEIEDGAAFAQVERALKDALMKNVVTSGGFFSRSSTPMREKFRELLAGYYNSGGVKKGRDYLVANTTLGDLVKGTALESVLTDAGKATPVKFMTAGQNTYSHGNGRGSIEVSLFDAFLNEGASNGSLDDFDANKVSLDDLVSAGARALLHEMQHALQRIYGLTGGAHGSDPDYENSIGEIEAFDVMSRVGGDRSTAPKLASWTKKVQSTMKPKRGRPGKIDQQAILDEIARIRGKDVNVAFAKFADIGASGEFSMNKDKTERLIKIAINSLNPMSVAWHESLHDFMAMLGGSKAERKLKADLLDAAEAPQVMFKLRELLKDHPDALKQIETDREERLAYMYQFWAEGALPLGQTGTNIFSRAVTFFREMLGVLSQDQKIDQLFTALHTGKFSEPSLVGAVLEDLKAKTLADRAREVSGPIGDAAEAMFTGATDRLRNTNVDALIELADLFHREPGRENPAMTQTSSGAKNSFVSNVDSIGRRAAERRLDAGESQESVFKDTGWFKSADGTMIKEVDDSKVFRRVWDTVHKAISTPENMLKLLDAVLDGKDAETLTTITLADLLRDLGLTEFAKKVGDIEVRFTTGQSNHVVSARRTGVKQVEIGLGYSAMQSGQDVSSIKDRAVRIANSAALTAIHELQHVLQTLDKRTMNDEGPYEQKESEIEAFDTEVRYVQRILNQMLGDDSDLGLPAIARLVAEADMSAGEVAEAFTSPMFIKAGKHKTERTAFTKRTTNELPFLQRRAQQVGKRLNKLQEILADTSAEDRRRALENMQAMKPASTPLEKELAAYLKELRDYMVDRGVKRFDTKTKKWTDLGNVKDYFPRVWDKEAIRNNEAEFINLMEQYIGKAQARETFNALVNGDGSLELAENEHALGFTPWNPSVLDRQFTFINPSNAAAFAKFQSKDMADIMTSYTQRAVHRAEYAHTFGNDGEVITKKFLEAQKQGATQDELAMARKATMAMEGTLGYDFNPRLKEVMSGIVTYQNIVLLPLSLFSNLIDPLGVAMRSNDMKEAWKAFTYGMKGIADQLRGAGDDAQTEMAKTLGLIDDQNMLEAMGHVYNSMHMSRFLKNVNSKFFRYNGMEMWNRRMRVAAMMAAQRFILANLGHERYQSELGITDSDVFQLQDGTIALTKDQLLQAGAKKSEVDEIEKRIQAAVFKWVDGAVLRPNAAHRPVWGSDPRYQLIFHLKQFTFSFHNTILRRVGEELKHGNVAPGWILMSYVPFMFLSDVLKGSLTGTLNTTADLYDVASQSIARSGIMGTGVFGADAMGDLERGKLPGTSFLGPAFGHLMTLLSGITGHAGVGQVVDRSVPFAKYV